MIILWDEDSEAEMLPPVEPIPAIPSPLEAAALMRDLPHEILHCRAIFKNHFREVKGKRVIHLRLFAPPRYT
jgi:hypothetical protein